MLRLFTQPYPKGNADYYCHPMLASVVCGRTFNTRKGIEAEFVIARTANEVQQDAAIYNLLIGQRFQISAALFTSFPRGRNGVFRCNQQFLGIHSPAWQAKYLSRSSHLFQVQGNVCQAFQFFRQGQGLSQGFSPANKPVLLHINSRVCLRSHTHCLAQGIAARRQGWH